MKIIGEDYFTSDGGSPLIFFQALWLTGQIERAISLLYKSVFLVLELTGYNSCYFPVFFDEINDLLFQKLFLSFL